MELVPFKNWASADFVTLVYDLGKYSFDFYTYPYLIIAKFLSRVYHSEYSHLTLKYMILG